MQGSHAGLLGSFTSLDWCVVFGVLAITTIIGERLAGKQSSMRDFFLGGRKLPWYAVSASIIATEISAVTYISLPSVVFKDGGNITYLQLGLIGSLMARMFIGYVLVPAYYEREIYSPYDYMGARLGEGMKRVTTLLFSLGGVLGQSARVYLTAVVLEVILQQELAWVAERTGMSPLVSAVTLIGVVAVLWTWIGGIAAVIWTDAILFLLFLVGISVALFTVGQHVEGGVSGALSAGWDAGKFRFFDASTDPTKAYTIWAAVIAASWGGIGSYGTDHLMAQRMFCCKNAREARKAIIASIAAMAVTFAVTLVGVGLWAYYKEHPMTGAALEMYTAKPDRVFPIFIRDVLPAGFKGLVIAGAFAAAISSLDSIMAALSQTSLSAIYLPWRKRELQTAGIVPDEEEEARHLVRVSRVLVLVWGIVLCAAAVGVDSVAARYDSILDLALAMASYTGGALIAAFFLAFLPTGRDGSGFGWAAALSVMSVYAVVWHGSGPQIACGGFALIVLAVWACTQALAGAERRPWSHTLWLVCGLVLVFCLTLFCKFDGDKVLAWPWYIPFGSTVAFVFGWLLGRPVQGTSCATS